MASVDSRDYVFLYYFISTVSKSSLGLISWATLLIHLYLHTEMSPDNNCLKHCYLAMFTLELSEIQY